MTRPHVRVETRKVYVSARGTKLTKHAAYIAAAKKLIAARCDCRRPGLCHPEQAEPCDCDAHTCRFHEQHTQTVDMTGMGHFAEEPIGMVHYRRVLTRLVRFLKFVDARQPRDR